MTNAFQNNAFQNNVFQEKRLIEKIHFPPISINDIFPVDNGNPVVLVDFLESEENTIVSAVRNGDDGSSVDIIEKDSMEGNWLFIKNIWLDDETPIAGHYKINIVAESPSKGQQEIEIDQMVVL